MKRSVTFLAVILLTGCALKSKPATTPEVLPDITGEYEFVVVGLGAGHGFMFLPGFVPTDQEMIFAVPGGKFTFYDDNTFKITFEILAESLTQLGPPAKIKDWPTFDEVTGTYQITSENTITLRTSYRSSEYLYSIERLGAEDVDGFINLRLMPAKDTLLKIGDDNSAQGSSVFDIIYLSRKVNKTK